MATENHEETSKQWSHNCGRSTACTSGKGARVVYSDSTDIAVDLTRDVEPNEVDDDGRKGQDTCREIHDE